LVCIFSWKKFFRVFFVLFQNRIGQRNNKKKEEKYFFHGIFLSKTFFLKFSNFPKKKIFNKNLFSQLKIDMTEF